MKDHSMNCQILKTLFHGSCRLESDDGPSSTAAPASFSTGNQPSSISLGAGEPASFSSNRVPGYAFIYFTLNYY